MIERISSLTLASCMALGAMLAVGFEWLGRGVEHEVVALHATQSRVVKSENTEADARPFAVPAADAQSEVIGLAVRHFQ